MKRLIFSIVLMLGVLSVFSQQDPQYSQYMFNHLAVNPGYAGNGNAICANALFRQQWLGFGDGAPTTTVFGVHAPIPKMPLGAGLTILQDNIGFEKNMSINLAASYQLDLDFGKLGLGASFGLFNKSLDGEWTTIEDNPYTDPYIPNAESAMVLDLGLGAFFSSDDYYVGVSATHINQPTIEYDETAQPYMAMHIYAVGGAFFELPNPLFELAPSALFKTDATQSSIDATLRLIYSRKYWGGVSYRLGDGYVAIFGLELPNQLRFGLSYDISTSKIGTYNNGSLEVTLGYCFNILFDRGIEKGSSIKM